MKLLKLPIYFVLGLSSLTAQHLYEESFETLSNGINYNTSITEFVSASKDDDYFTRTNTSNITSSYNVTGVDGSYFFSGQDIDLGDNSGTLPVFLTTIPITITGLNEIEFSILIAEDDDGVNNDWDKVDYVHISYTIDGGTKQNLLWIESDSADDNNRPPTIDTDFDGIGDGKEITSTFAEFSRFIPVSGNSIVFEIEFNLNAGDEDIAIDKIVVTNPNVLSIEDQEKITNTLFDFYPNPVNNGIIHIVSNQATTVNATLFDSFGKMIHKQKTINNQIDINTLNPGIYILELSHNGFSEVKKLVIE